MSAKPLILFYFIQFGESIIFKCQGKKLPSKACATGDAGAGGLSCVPVPELMLPSTIAMHTSLGEPLALSEKGGLLLL